MKKTYDIRKPEEFLQLARDVQAKVYWGERFYLSEDTEPIPYKDFYYYVEVAIRNGDFLIIIEDADVTFSKIS